LLLFVSKIPDSLNLSGVLGEIVMRGGN
jgi:hypothetical protein